MRTFSMRLSALLLVGLSTASASAQDHAFSLEFGDFSVVDAGKGPAVVLMLDSYNVVDDYTYVRFDISSHWPILDEPEKFNETLLRFFEKHARR